MPIVEQRKTIIVSAVLGAGDSSFNSYLNVPFTPDEIIVRGISYWNGNANNGLRIMRSNLVFDRLLGFFNESQTPTNTEGYFSNQHQINGNYLFEILGANGAALATPGSISVHLEFVKYKERKRSN